MLIKHHNIICKCLYSLQVMGRSIETQLQLVEGFRFIRILFGHAHDNLLDLLWIFII